MSNKPVFLNVANGNKYPTAVKYLNLVANTCGKGGQPISANSAALFETDINRLGDGFLSRLENAIRNQLISTAPVLADKGAEFNVKYKTIEISPDQADTSSAAYLAQVISHEIAHAEYASTLNNLINTWESNISSQNNTAFFSSRGGQDISSLLNSYAQLGIRDEANAQIVTFNSLIDYYIANPDKWDAHFTANDNSFYPVLASA